MAPTDSLSPAGSSTYSSNLMYVGDGTWDASRNTFLLPNLVGLNYEMMRYNGMGNRFKSLSQYHQIITGHGILAALTFLLLVPTAIFIAQFHARSSIWAIRLHIYIQITTVLLSTVVFTLGWFAVGPSRSFTNPHHGIGAAIYLMVLLQALIGFFLHRRPNKRSLKRYILTFILHQWIGRATALLGFAQVALGLALYGSPKFLFIIYSLWMSFLLLLFFILSYRAHLLSLTEGPRSTNGGMIMKDRRPSRMGSFLGPIAVGAGAAALLRDRDRSRSHSRKTREKTSTAKTASRKRRKGSFDEKSYESRQTKHETSETKGKMLSIAGVAGLAKGWNDKKHKAEDDDLSSEPLDTLSSRNRKHRRHSETRHGNVSREQIDDLKSKTPKVIHTARSPVTAGALNHTGPELSTPQPMHHRESYDSDSSIDDTTITLSRRQSKLPENRNKIFSFLGMGWLAKRMKKQADHKEHDRNDRNLIEDERKARHNRTPSRPTGNRSPRGTSRSRRYSSTSTSDLSSDDERKTRSKLDIPTSLIKEAMSKSKPQQTHNNIAKDEIISMPRLPQEPHRIPHPSLNPPSHVVSSVRHQRRNSSSRRREGETAAAAAVAEAAKLESEEKNQRQSSRGRVIELPSSASEGPRTPVSVKLQLHEDKNHVTLRRLTKEEADAEREARKNDPRWKRTGSISSISGFDTALSNRRYRRSEREAERRSELPASLAPPSPAMSRKPKDDAYYSGGLLSSGSNLVPPGAAGVLDGRESWSVMSPSARGDNGDAAAERRRRRRQERSQRDGIGDGTGEKQGSGGTNQGDNMSYSNA